MAKANLTPEKEWTIIITIYADFRVNGSNLKRELDRLYEDLSNCFLNDQFNVLVVRNIIDPDPKTPLYEKDVIKVYHLLGDDNQAQNDFNEILSISTPFCIQKPEVIGDIFRRIHRNEFFEDYGLVTRASRYFLMTWDHGSGFGIFRVDDKSPVSTVRLRILDEKSGEVGITTVTVKRMGINNMINVKDDMYEVFERTWEKPIYQYRDTSNQLLFELNTANSSDNILHASLTDPQILTHMAYYVKDNGERYVEFQSAFFVNYILNILLSTGFENNEIKKFLDHFRINERFNFEMQLGVRIDKLLDILTNDELAEAIHAGFDKRQIDVLLMMNCIALNIHSCYAFRNTVQFLVAPQGEITEPGYNYSVILNEIYESFDSMVISPDDLAKRCVSSVSSNASARRTVFRSAIDNWVIMCIDLREFNTITNLIDEIAGYILRLEATQPQLEIKFFLHAARGRCVRFDNVSTGTDYFMIDFIHWFTQLVIDLKKEGIDTYPFAISLSLLRNDLKARILIRQIGSGIYQGIQAGFLTLPPSGCTIFFPIEFRETDDYKYFIENSSFLVNEKNWKKFLANFFR